MKNKQLSDLEIAKLQSDLFQSRNEIIRLEKNLINKTNISNQLKDSLTESFERELKLKAERDALAARIQAAERVEKIFSETPELTFDDCLKLFADEISEIEAKAVEKAANLLRFAPVDGDQKWAVRYVDLLEYADKVRSGEK